MVDKLSEEEIYRLAEKCRDWRISGEEPISYIGRAGEIYVQVRRDAPGIDKPLVAVVIYGAREISVAVGSVCTSDPRFGRIYRRAKRSVREDRNGELSEDWDARVKEGILEARKLLAE